jgi:hypothetical protein
MAGATTQAKRERGSIRKRGNAYQVIVFAGQDPITGKQSYLRGTAHSEREAERLRVKLRAQVHAQRSTATRVNLAYALDVWLENHEAAQTTIDGYRGYIERTIKWGSRRRRFRRRGVVGPGAALGGHGPQPAVAPQRRRRRHPALHGHPHAADGRQLGALRNARGHP